MVEVISKRTRDAINLHTQAISQNIYITFGRSGFYTQELDFTKYLDPAITSKRPLESNRDEYKSDITKLYAFFDAMEMLCRRDDFYVDIPETTSFFLPTISSFSSDPTKGVRVSSKEKVIFFRQSDEDIRVCLLPGNIIDRVYVTSSMSSVISFFERMCLSLDSTETLTTLRDKLVTYLRSRIKRSLKSSSLNDSAILYRLNDPNDELLPIERMVTSFLDPETYSPRSPLLSEFRLLFSPLNQEEVLYIEEGVVVIEEASKYLSGDQDGRHVITNPILASHVRTERYNFPISVSLRALHLNYAYQVTSTDSSKESIYEDFIGDANWVIAPIVIVRSKGILHGKVETLPSFLHLTDTCASK